MKDHKWWRTYQTKRRLENETTEHDTDDCEPDIDDDEVCDECGKRYCSGHCPICGSRRCGGYCL